MTGTIGRAVVATGPRRRAWALRCLAPLLTLADGQAARAANVWDTPVPRSAAFEPAPGAAGKDVGLSTWLRPDKDSLPIYEADADDPLVPILYAPQAWAKVASGPWARSGNPPEVEAEIRAAMAERLPSRANVYSSQSASAWVLPNARKRPLAPERGPLRVRAPRAAVPAPSTDGHLAIRQPDGRVLELYAAIRLSTGEFVALNYNVSDLGSMLDGNEGGVTASLLPVYAGVIREAEVRAGRIGHAMKIVVPAAMLAPRYVYPALAFDRGALTEDPPYSGDLPMGARLAIPPSVDLDALGLATSLGRLIAEAARTYGFIIADRGGGGITIAVERGVTEPALVEWRRAERQDLGAIVRAVRVVRQTAQP